MPKYFLGIDQGTTGTTVLLINEKWDVVSRGYCKHKQIYPQPGWVEHDAEEILGACLSAVRQAVDGCPDCSKQDIVSVGIDNQGETCTVWNAKTGKPIHNALVWQDRRTADLCDQLRETHGEYIRKTTGLYADAYYSASKFTWILDTVEGARDMAARGELCAGTLDSFLIYRLTNRKSWITDASTAGRTMLMNIRTGQWDEEMLDLFRIPKRILPPIHDCSQVYGVTDPAVFLGMQIPICASLADTHAALIAQGCLDVGDIKATYGTGCFINMITGKDCVLPGNGLTVSLPFQINGKRTYAFDGSVYIAGAAVDWLKDGLGLIASASDTQRLAESVSGTNSMYFVPAFNGLAAPWWDQYARGTIVGITASVTKAHLVRATLESIAFQVYDNMEAMRKCAGTAPGMLRAGGGPVDNAFLMQFQADILGSPVQIPVEKETSAYGAAFLAALAIGEFGSICDSRQCLKMKMCYEPQLSEDERLSKIDMWHKAVQYSRNWAR